MGHTMSRYARPTRRQCGFATGQVPFTPLWQPTRLVPRIRRHATPTLQQPVTCRSSVRIRRIKRIFRAHQYVNL